MAGKKAKKSKKTPKKQRPKPAAKPKASQKPQKIGKLKYLLSGNGRSVIFLLPEDTTVERPVLETESGVKFVRGPSNQPLILGKGGLQKPESHANKKRK